MITYNYTAKDPHTGKKIKATVQATSEKAAASTIQKMGYVPLSIMQLDLGKNDIISRIKKRVPTKDRIMFSRQLSTLVAAGLPLVQSLRQVQEQTRNKTLQAVISNLISDVETGSAFSKALERHPDVFNDVFINLVAAGETSGTLDATLDRLSTQQEKDAEVLSKVRGAMVYPIIVIIVMVLVVAFMLIKVLPQVQLLYDGLPGARLPWITQILLTVSRFAVKFWWLLLAIVIGMSAFGSRWARTLGGKRVVDKLKMRVPPFGPLFMKLYMARFSRTGNTLIASGVPLIQVLEITGGAVANIYIQESLKGAIEKVKGGKALSEALTGDPNFLSLVPNMIKIGEQSGSLDKMLERTADYYEKEVDNEIRTVSTIIEPLMMVILGGAALVIVAAVLLPVYGLAGQDVIR